MKKSKIIVNVLLLCILFFNIIIFAVLINPCRNYYEVFLSYKDTLNSWSWDKDNIFDNIQNTANECFHYFLQTIFPIIFAALSALISGALLIILNVTDAKNAIFKHKQITEERKAAKEQAQAERAEEAKQAKIKALEEELQRLKND